MAPKSSLLSLPLKVLLIIGSSCYTSAFLSPASSRVKVSFRALLEQISSSSPSRCRRLSRTRSRISVQRGSSDNTSSQTQSADENLFFARELGVNHSIDNAGSRRQDDFSNELGDEYSYTQQIQEYSQESDFQTHTDYPSSSPSWQNNHAASLIVEEESSYSSSSNNNQELFTISSVDARVLQSILQEGKLDFSTEAEVKRLLEGPQRLDEEDIFSREDKDEKYNSKFVNVSSSITHSSGLFPPILKSFIILTLFLWESCAITYFGI